MRQEQKSFFTLTSPLKFLPSHPIPSHPIPQLHSDASENEERASNRDPGHIWTVTRLSAGSPRPEGPGMHRCTPAAPRWASGFSIRRQAPRKWQLQARSTARKFTQTPGGCWSLGGTSGISLRNWMTPLGLTTWWGVGPSSIP